MAKDIIPPDNVFYDIIEGISNNEDVDASVTNRPIEQLAANIKFLKNLISQLESANVGDISQALSTKLDASKLNQPNGVAGLGSDGRLKPEQTPLISISETRTFNTVVERDTWVDPIEGDVAIIIGKTTYMRTATTWQELPMPPASGAVSSVNGKTGTVQLTNADIGAEPAFVKLTGFNKSFGKTANTVAEGNHTHDFSSITNRPSSYPPTTHYHTISQITNLDNTLANIVNSVTTVDNRLTALDGRVSAVESIVSTLDGRATTLDGRITEVFNKSLIVRQRFTCSGLDVFELDDERQIFAVTLNGIDLDDGDYLQTGTQLNVTGVNVGDIIISYRQG